jgi:hypothetical protein
MKVLPHERGNFQGKLKEHNGGRDIMREQGRWQQYWFNRHFMKRIVHQEMKTT